MLQFTVVPSAAVGDDGVAARDRCSPQKCSVGDLNHGRSAMHHSLIQNPLPALLLVTLFLARMLGRGFEPRSSARKAEMIGRTTPTEPI